MNNFSPEVRRLLRAAGFEFHRSGKGDHQIWRHPTTGRSVTVDSKIKSRHSANQALKEAGLPKAF
jgi:predicted RNA binding protein YcfA (HicA-like mRNA interferase family)